tara:strand:+ start:3093 stop:3641 length:549 start_codon:yes stop_codon:yes gene_type:complete
MSTSKIDDLPVENVTLEKQEVVQQPNLQNSQIPNNIQPASNDTVNQIVSSLNNSPGLGQLPSRDIPMNTNPLTQDAQMQPNYVPSNNQEDYIQQYDNFVSLANKSKDAEVDKQKNDLFYEQLQVPLLVGVLFFLFQLPFIRKILFTKLPMLFTGDGQPKISLYLLKTSLFVGLFYGSQRFLL